MALAFWENYQRCTTAILLYHTLITAFNTV